jgi:tRNA(fMet)-specific endonuclease VapC
MRALDTDSLTLAYYGNEPIASRVDRDRDSLAVPIIAQAEILIGRWDALLKAGAAGEIEEMQHRLFSSQSFLNRFTILHWNVRAGIEFAALKANRKLRKVGHRDLQIAALALADRLTLITRNTKDFSLVPGLSVEDWTR